ncbi:CTP synthetase [Thalassococcus sp. S3]|uniref:CTP synthetase n=1 Tax=Thalassococcus sp. S3 TaxID=2017482 RepID=UPI0010248BC1|nr:CTP synthetase [Thalassococcus sp. S3]QBF31031.1 CTP synthetase [Thalassococcus sp. S3]
MFRLALILHIFIGSTFAGTGVIAALVAGFFTTPAIIAGALIGFLVAFPVSWLVAKKLHEEA